jgi:hypothetical protein
MRIAAALAWLLLLGASGPAAAQITAQPIPGVPGWTLSRPAGNSGCFARLAGDEVDTLLTTTHGGASMVLAAGRPDWKLSSAPEDVTLEIDGAASYRIQAAPIGNVVFGVVSDPAMAGALRKAQRLTWTLPNGRFTANVSGLGAAFDAVRACVQATR